MNIADLVRQLAGQTTVGGGSEHIDSVREYTGHRLAGREFVLHCSTLLERAILSAKEEARIAADVLVALYIPLGDSEELQFWSEAMWSECGGHLMEPPSLYLLKPVAALPGMAEHYRFSLSVDWLPRYRAVYASSRDAEGVANGWPWSRGIFLMADGSW